MSYKSVILPTSVLHDIARADGAEQGADIIEHFLNASAKQGKHIVSHSTFGAPRPGSELSPRGPEIELVYHFIFEDVMQ